MSSLLRQAPLSARPSRRSAPSLRPSLCAISLSLCCAFALSSFARAAAIDESIPTPDVLAQLEQRASQASPREQPFLYTMLVHTMTEKAGKEISEGDTAAAAATLKQINRYAHLIQASLARNTSQLKNAEMLMHHTTFRLGQFLHLVSGPDKDSVQDTLLQLDQVNDALLTQVFQH
jgi:hypothetical protein